MIVKGSDDEAVSLGKCLANVAPYVRGIFVTITQPNEQVERVAKAFGAHVSHFEWCNDFAAARNFNFSQVPKDYTHILWLDADDVIRGGDRLEDIVENNADVDAFSMFYLYAFDKFDNPIVVHQKTQIVKNDGSFVWAGRLHEDFAPTREVETFLIQNIERIHVSDETRFKQSQVRNLEVAEAQISSHPDDPRSYWNLANSLSSLGEYTRAIETFNKFLELSHSDEEKYIARLRLAEAYWALGNYEAGIEAVSVAIGMKPAYPDAYHLKGSLLFSLGKYEEAADMYKMGLVMKPPYYKILVYNPRDYDYTPLMNLAKCYFAMKLPDMALVCLKGCKKIQPKDTGLDRIISDMEKEVKEFEEVTEHINRLRSIEDDEELKAELEKIPEKYQSHPGICNLRNTRFIKTESTGREISYVCSFTEEEWNPDTIKKKGIGGSEEAVFHLAKRWARYGWKVTVYNNCGTVEKEYDGVTYKPYWTWNYRDKQDVVILWRTPKMAAYQINAPKVFVDMHDVIPKGEFTEDRLKNITKIFVKSKFQRDIFPNVPDDKFVILPNGIDSKVFDQKIERDPNLIINTSAPNRAIYALTHMFSEIKKRVPTAKLKWAYGWGTFDNGFRGDGPVMQWKQELQKKMQELGVEELGRVNHDEVAKLYMQANVWAYPSGFGEIDCISLSKAMAAGAMPVTTDFAALGEKQGHGGVFLHSDLTSENWAKPRQHDFSIIDPEQIQKSVDAIVEYLQNPPSEEERDKMRQWAKATYDWENIAKKWEEYMIKGSNG